MAACHWHVRFVPIADIALHVYCERSPGEHLASLFGVSIHEDRSIQYYHSIRS